MTPNERARIAASKAARLRKFSPPASGISARSLSLRHDRRRRIDAERLLQPAQIGVLHLRDKAQRSVEVKTLVGVGGETFAELAGSVPRRW